jgi:hypothetical protein
MWKWTEPGVGIEMRRIARRIEVVMSEVIKFALSIRAVVRPNERGLASLAWTQLAYKLSL